MHQTKRGFTLVEVIIYLSITMMLSVVLVNSFLIVMRAFNAAQAASVVSVEASSILERTVREIRNANGVDVGASTFGSDPGTLVLNTVDVNGGAATVRLWSDGTDIFVQNVSGESSKLSSPGITVGRFEFNRFSTSTTDAIQIDLVLSATRGRTTIQKEFHTASVIRGAY